jgi:hypothetical protein
LSSIIKVDQIQSDSGNVNLTGNLSATTITTNTLSSTTGNVTVTSNVSVVGLQTSSNVSIAGKTLVDSTGRQYSVIDNGTTLFEEYKCRAWVNFDGTTATPSTIRASGNVSSVTKNGTGDYTVNFTTVMPDANYGFTFGTQFSSDTTATQFAAASSLTAQTTSALRIRTVFPTIAYQDPPFVCVSIFR